MTQDMVSAAISYTTRGWAVVQLHDVTAGQCSCQEGPECKSAGKHPLQRAWQTGYLRRPEDAWRAWTARPAAGIGIVTGEPSGVWVLDVDPDHGGFESLAGLRAQHDGGWEPLAVARTGGGGEHYYWSLRPGEDKPNSVGRIGAGLDVRGRGGFVVASPSTSGKGRYSWILEPAA